MRKPSDWTEPASSAELRDRMAASTALLAFSTGKDAIAAWLAIRPHFARIVPVHYELVPGLDFVQRSLAYYENFFECKIIRRAHPSFVRWLRNCVFQPPDRWVALEGAHFPPEHNYNQEAILQEVRRDLALGDDVFVATGVRAADSPHRMLSVRKHGAVNWTRQSWWPVYDWKIGDVEQALAAAHVRLPIDYQLWGRTFDGLDHRFLEPMSRMLPDDYARVIEWFPLADLEIFRRRLSA